MCYRRRWQSGIPKSFYDAVVWGTKQDALLLVQRPFEDGDIEGADVVIMATNDSEVNSHIAAICKDKRILVNVVDVKKDCGFYFPAIIKQDDVVVSVSTGGSAPALASQIKKSIRSHLPGNCGDMAKTLLEKRNAVLKTEPEEEKRKEIMLDMSGKNQSFGLVQEKVNWQKFRPDWLFQNCRRHFRSMNTKLCI